MNEWKLTAKDKKAIAKRHGLDLSKGKLVGTPDNVTFVLNVPKEGGKASGGKRVSKKNLNNK